MYEAHFGLEHRPFGETVSPSVYVSVPSRDAVLRRLRYALEHRQGPAVLFGPAGSGKTLLTHRLASELGGPAIHVTFPALSAFEMVEHIALELGVTAAPTAISSGCLLRQSARATLGPGGSRPRRPLGGHRRRSLDRIGLLLLKPYDLLAKLLRPRDLPTCRFSLPEGSVAKSLARASSGLADPAGARCLVFMDHNWCKPSHRHTSSGRSPAPPGARKLRCSLQEGLVAAFTRAADGLPRRLNRLADLALLIAYSQDLETANASVVAIAAREFNRDVAA